VALRWSRVAVWMRLRGRQDGIAFLANGSADVLRQLERHDVPVNRSVAQIKRVEELYRPPG
jgi:predicted component of type VI protein secretion system